MSGDSRHDRYRTASGRASGRTLAGVAKVHVGSELRQFLVSEAGVGEERNDGLVSGSKILRTDVGGGIPHCVDLLGCEPDSGLLVLSFRIR